MPHSHMTFGPRVAARTQASRNATVPAIRHLRTRPRIGLDIRNGGFGGRRRLDGDGKHRDL